MLDYISPPHFNFGKSKPKERRKFITSSKSSYQFRGLGSNTFTIPKDLPSFVLAKVNDSLQQQYWSVIGGGGARIFDYTVGSEPVIHPDYNDSVISWDTGIFQVNLIGPNQSRAELDVFLKLTFSYKYSLFQIAEIMFG